MSGATLTECVSQTANPCTGYGLMVNLEKNDNVVLTTDADQTLTGLVGTYTDTAAAGAPGGKLNTTSDKCEATMSTGGVEQCYDLKP
jgi:hypothetical protein